jgi:hypothetical protein
MLNSFATAQLQQFFRGDNGLIPPSPIGAFWWAPSLLTEEFPARIHISAATTQTGSNSNNPEPYGFSLRCLFP